jgi:hypothetical protein
MRGVSVLEIAMRHVRVSMRLAGSAAFLSLHGLVVILVFGGILAMVGCIGVTGKPANSTPGGVGTPAITVTPASVNFGAETVGSTAAQAMQIANTGTADLTVSQITVSGADFSYANFAVPTTIPAGQSATLTADFKPSATGSASGSLSIGSNASSSPMMIALSGVGESSNQGNPGISASPTSIGFGSVAVGSSATQPLSVSNTGSSNLTISNVTQAGSAFTWSGLAVPTTLTPGQSANLTIEFQPETTGSLSGSLTITSNASSSPLVVNYSGTGVAASRQLTANPTSLNFGTVKIGASATLNVTITNTGNSNVSTTTVTVTGAGFSESGGSSLTLTPGQSTTIAVTWAPSGSGAGSGSLTIPSNAQNSPLVVPLSGSGSQSAPPSVALSWSASTSQVIGYYVYRGMGPTGPYSRLNTSPNPSTSYTDTTVSNNQTYYYYVTSVNSNDVESVPSTQVSVLVP